ncbi:DUF3179 domain-containing protein [Aurantimonas sp. A2-1-M11]|uniref:DUF3179 domain-containing protein n=1 Tax=Aurantimonas sp. A2-1-M11 TaxID=3113712 RepID=UPI002F95B0EA
MIQLLAALAMILVGDAARAQPDSWRQEWPETDFSRSAVDFAEIVSGGPPKDGIPAIDAPRFRKASDETRLDPREPVMSYAPKGVPGRAYPIRYLMWHEIVNDVVADIPIAVTYCPLCNSGMVFDTRIDGMPHTFGVSGKLRHSDMIMYDRQTESWWQQAVGEGIVGALTGQRLTALPARMESWQAFRAAHPDGLVLDEPDRARAYGHNPYVGYDGARRPFLYTGENPPHGIPPLARVVRVGERAWPLERLRQAGRIEEAGVTLEWRPGQASALDSDRIAEGREVGDVVVRDAQGQDIAYDIPFAFAFHAFYPKGGWMLGRGAR